MSSIRRNGGIGNNRSATVEHFETHRSKKGRGRAQRSLDLIEAMYDAAEAAQPITGRGIGYKLFTAGLIPSMARAEMQRVYRLLKEAREDGTIPWDWIVDETRALERTPTWSNPTEYARTVARSYRSDFWDQQPQRVEVWSEKGTVRGVLAPVLDRYAVGFRVMHGFSSATSVHDVAEDDDGRDLTALYVGDYDPSGLFMSEQDLPSRLAESWRLAMLVRQGTLDRAAAVDQLWEIAIAHALVRALGEDRVQAIFDEAFADADFRPMHAEVA
jgi:hypothetical protein